jgi:hypothetical protein
LDDGDQWAAVDLYEQILGNDPNNAAARRGLEEARAIARWSAQMAGAGDDAQRLQAIADEFAEIAPTLAVRSFDAAFAARPTIIGLHRWLKAAYSAGQSDQLDTIARHGVKVLRAEGRVGTDGTQDAACDALAGVSMAGFVNGDAITAAIEALSATLVAAARQSHP